MVGNQVSASRATIHAFKKARKSGSPLFTAKPARLASSGRYAEPVSTLDLFMTVARAAEVELPSDRAYDGVDLLPYLRGERSGPPHEALFWRAGGHRAIRAGAYKLVSDARTGTRVLYDMAQDPSEQRDLSAREPARVEELEARLRAWEATLVPPRWPNVMEFRFREDGRDFVFPL